MNLRKRIEKLESCQKKLYTLKDVRSLFLTLKLEDLESFKRETFENERTLERRLLRKIACGAVGHQFVLRWVVFEDKEAARTPYGKFECTECFLKVDRLLTDDERKAAKKLGMM